MPEPSATFGRQKVLIVLLAIIALVLVAFALRQTRVVTMPLTFAFFVTLLMRPIQHWLENRLPSRLWWLSIVGTMAVIVFFLAAFAAAAWYALYTVAADGFEQHVQGLREQWQTMTQWLEERNLPVPQAGEAQAMGTQAADLVQWAMEAVLELLLLLVLVFFFVLLMLIELGHWRRKAEVTTPGDRQRDLLDAVDAIALQVRHFLAVQALVATITAVAAGLWLWMVGVPYAFLWALLTFVMDFVPNIGPILASAMAVVVALVLVGWKVALATAIGLMIIQQVMGNYVDPLLKGRRMQISPLVVLFSVILWSWIWGAAGAIVAVPITATVIIACAHVPALRPIALLLSRTGDEDRLIAQTYGPRKPEPEE